MASESTFDVVNKVDKQEVANALNNLYELLAGDSGVTEILEVDGTGIQNSRRRNSPREC